MNDAHSVASIGQDAGSDREQRAIVGPTPRATAPAASPIDHDSNAVVGGDGQTGCDTQWRDTISATIKELVQHQKLRRFAITEKNRSERALEALIAGLIGFNIDAAEKERKATYARAKAIRLAVESGKNGADIDDKLFMAIAPLIKASFFNRQMYLDSKEEAESNLALLARQLPVHEFAKKTRGFGELGLAVLTAEAGRPIGEYRTVSALWKRMGVAVIGSKDQWTVEDDRWVRVGEPALNDKIQQRCTDKIEADIHGYVPKRRAEVWAFTDSLFKGQWHGWLDEDGNNPKKTGKPEVIPPGPRGPYGEVYAQRRAHTEPRIAETEHLPYSDRRKWVPARCDKDARRIMSKALLRDLWRVWNGMLPRGSAPAD